MQVGDVFDSIDGRPVNGLKLLELAPLIRGPVGSSVTICLLRKVLHVDRKQEIVVDLVRGSALYFLSQENQRASSKLGTMNTQVFSRARGREGKQHVFFFNFVFTCVYVINILTPDDDTAW